MNSDDTLPKNSDDKSEIYPVFDAIDHEILLHRDAHFGGNFGFMLNYYSRNGKGIRDEFSIDRMLFLAEFEKQIKENLAGLVLSGPEAENVAKAKEAYKKLRDLYETCKQKLPLLIADLILSENEEEEAAMTAVVKEKTIIVRSLIDLVRSEDFYDPLFPGYGLAPELAMKCLGKIGDKRSIISLFEALGQGDFFSDEVIIEALYAIGKPAETFLLKVVSGRPFNDDNEKAAMALIRFKDDPEVALHCLTLLKNPAVLQHIPLATYLILGCEGLNNLEQRQEFIQLAQNQTTPKELQLDFKTIISLLQ
jgi:hypothetical protein